MLSHFSASDLQSPRESCQPWMTTAHTKHPQAPALVCCKAWIAPGLGSSWLAAAARGAHRVSSFVLTFAGALQLGEKKITDAVVFMLKPPGEAVADEPQVSHFSRSQRYQQVPEGVQNDLIQPART